MSRRGAGSYVLRSTATRIIHRAGGAAGHGPVLVAPNRCIQIPANEALSLPTEESVQIALRTQQIIAHVDWGNCQKR